MDYEKKYNDALNLAKSYYGKGSNEFLDTIFPELAESEDERIRRAIVETIKQCPDTFLNPKNRDGMLAYLERQKEQKPGQYLSEKDVFAIMSKLTNLSFSELIPIGSDEYKKIREITSDVRRLLDCPIEQKPAEWSEEDKKILDELLDHCNTENATWYNWLKSLRPQPKQDVLPSLREKEIICLKRALDYLRKEHNRYGGEDFTNEIAVLEWLITHPILVSDTHWKP